MASFAAGVVATSASLKPDRSRSASWYETSGRFATGSSDLLVRPGGIRISHGAPFGVARGTRGVGHATRGVRRRGVTSCSSRGPHPQARALGSARPAGVERWGGALGRVLREGVQARPRPPSQDHHLELHGCRQPRRRLWCPLSRFGSSHGQASPPLARRVTITCSSVLGVKQPTRSGG